MVHRKSSAVMYSRILERTFGNENKGENFTFRFRKESCVSNIIAKQQLLSDSVTSVTFILNVN